jgi:hypothetical protein
VLREASIERLTSVLVATSVFHLNIMSDEKKMELGCLQTSCVIAIRTEWCNTALHQ